MSKNVVMATDGSPQYVASVEKIQTRIADSGSMDWLPEDETVSTTLYITENGQYSASNTGFYGYHKVDVMVAGGSGAEIETDRDDGSATVKYVTPPVTSESGSSFVSKDPETGNVTYYAINDNGQIIEKLVPSYAMVTTKPKDHYVSGELVDYTGAVITLYNGDGTVATNYNNGVLTYGTSAWNSYVETASGKIDDVKVSNIVVMYVKPWWYKDGTKFDKSYYIRAYYDVVID